ncbi:MAG: beta-N-acetylhexosaminidase, partial [Acidimicrobiales bacterium]
MDRRTFLGAATGGAIATLLPMSAARAQSTGRPETIPALREWTATGGQFSLCASSRVITGDAGLHREAELLAGELGLPLDSGPVQPGDIALDRYAGDAELGPEGYRLEISGAVTISANAAAAGAFYGNRSLRQLLARGQPLPGGVARDWPRYPERGLMVDTGRKHFSAAWLASRIEEMAWLKLNYLHLHFTENLGWRIECDGHPEVVSDEHLTKTEVRELLALADRYHITVVPELDLPGHMGAALEAHPEHQLRDLLGRPNANNLDYTLPAARQFAFELIDEYVDLFPGPYWHTGADEYLTTIPAVPTPVDYALYPQLESYARQRYGSNATAKDGILGLVNEVDDFVRARGKTLRVWNDGLSGGRTIVLDPDVIVEWWSDLDGRHPPQLLAAGHHIMNCGWYPTYYVTGFPGGFVPGWPREVTFPNVARPEDAYEAWEPHSFHGPLRLYRIDLTQPYVIDPAEPAHRGSKLHVWCDDPTAQTVDEIATGIAPYLSIMAQQTWGSAPLAASYADFRPIVDRVGRPSDEVELGVCAPDIA